jgi:hypothetical protein
LDVLLFDDHNRVDIRCTKKLFNFLKREIVSNTGISRIIYGIITMVSAIK